MPDLPNLPQTEIAIVALTNAFRQENKLGAVTPNKELAAAARWFAEYLARTGKLAHEADGREPQQRASAHGYKYCMVAENLARNLDSRGYTAQRLAAEVVEGWKTRRRIGRTSWRPTPPRSAYRSCERPTSIPNSCRCRCSAGPRHRR